MFNKQNKSIRGILTATKRRHINDTIKPFNQSKAQNEIISTNDDN